MIAHWRNRQIDTESGQASMVTVAMFMMLFAVIAVSFTYIVVTASRQATNDSLQASAKAAAESGVEDAKRLLVYCYKHKTGDNTYSLTGPDLNLCRKVIGHRLDDQDCNTIISALHGTKAGNSFNVKDDERVIVGSSSDGTGNDGTEYYQCLKIATKSTAYKDVINGGGDSAIIPLKLVNASGNVTNPAKIVVQWHRNSVGEAGDQLVSGLSGGSGLPNATVWNSANSNRPAVLRVEQVGAPKDNISINNLIANDSAVTLRPSTGGSTTIAIANYHYTNPDRPNTGNQPIVETKCSSDTNKPYACSMTITGSYNLGAMDYYLRLNAIYKNTHFSVSAYDSAGNQLYFDGVQPTIDVTGRSSDSFSRIQASLAPNHNDDGNRWWPEYAIDTDGKVCKDMSVYYKNGTDNCAY